MTTAYGKRLADAREVAELTQSALAPLLGVSQAFLSQVEKAERAFATELVAAAAQALKLPESFFRMRPTLLDVPVPTFRKSKQAKATDERRIVRLQREAARVFEWASQESGYFAAQLPDKWKTWSEADVAAALRKSQGISHDGPIPNMTRFLERLGFGVIHTLDVKPAAESAHSGISIPSSHVNRPLISTPTLYRGDAARFTLAHELAHHIWDQDSPIITSTRSPEEVRAHRFASALLLPPHVLRARVTEGLSLNGYLPIKADYGISVGAIIMAAKDARIVSPQRARSLQIQLNSRGWRKEEPVEVPNETPLLFKQALERTAGRERVQVETLTGLPASILTRWTGLEFADNVTSLAEFRRRRYSSS